MTDEPTKDHNSDALTRQHFLAAGAAAGATAVARPLAATAQPAHSRARWALPWGATPRAGQQRVRGFAWSPVGRIRIRPP
jgi:hypothetical protein